MKERIDSTYSRDPQFMLSMKYLYDDNVKQVGMGRTCSTHVGDLINIVGI